ncbi:MAG: Mrp/NBP35 family ATP-binding protein [candidate division NC10 bacterium]|nr:Mrp/NBP35 family ATP-binding protein [candidate division NC10 bacterium]
MDTNRAAEETLLECPSHREKKRERSEEILEEQLLSRRMGDIRYKILVLSGKGGVGKSTVAANMAFCLSTAGKQVGLLDADIHGPSIPKLLNIEGSPVVASGQGIMPIQVKPNLKVMSIGLLLDKKDEAVIWRGPMKYNAIKQFLKDVEWGELDYLVIDSPPGTGDEPLTVAQLIGGRRSAVIVTTPQGLALADVRKSITFCRRLALPVLGVIENMSGFVCPKCGEVSNIFMVGGGEAMAKEMGVPFLGRIPIDPKIVEACDLGQPYVSIYAQSEASKSLSRIILPILEMEKGDTVTPPLGSI